MRAFRAKFGLPPNDPEIILNGPDPGIVNPVEVTEANLDIQWSGAVAKAAQIKFVVSKSTYSTDGVFLSAQYAVDNNLAPVISVSFGACEEFLGPMNLAYAALWQQAATEGISVVVASGDSGAAGCDSPSAARAVNGMVVNGLASSPFNVAAGGTEFDDGNSQQVYWNGTPNVHLSSAEKYIPEAVWNDSATRLNLDAGGGGVSQLYEPPAWQTGPGVPTEDPGASGQHHR